MSHHFKECPAHEDYECPSDCEDGVLEDTSPCEIDHGVCECEDIYYDLEADAADSTREFELYG